MYKLFIKKLLASLALAATLSASALAAKIDLDQEIHISAGRQAGDLKNKIASYLDDVVITQGSFKIKADLVQVYSQKDQDVRNLCGERSTGNVLNKLLEDGSKIRLASE